MPNPINYDNDKVTLRELIDMCDQFANTKAADLTADQVALLNLRRVIEMRKDAKQGAAIGGGREHECFICATGA